MSIRYLLIDTDGVGSFGTQPDPGYTTQWLDGLVGPEGWYRVPLNPAWLMSGFVNDCGLLAPETYPRNVVGSVVLCTLGAGQQPYAGPVVITGWDASATARGGLEISTLQDPHVEELTRCLTDVRRALGLEPGQPSGRNGRRWVAEAREFAEHVRTAPTPGITVLSGEDAIAHLRGLKRGKR